MKLRPLPYNKACGGCARLLHKGETAWFGKHAGARCPECGPTAASAPTPAPETPAPIPAEPRAKRAPRPAPGKYPPATRGEDGVHRCGWESVADLVADAFSDRAQSEANREDIARRIAGAEGGRWANHHTVASIKAAVGSPSKKLLGAIDAMRESLADDVHLPVVPRRKVRHGRDEGDALDPDRWLIREPMAWDRCERELRSRTNVGIGINLSVHAGQKPDELLYRGAAACALADLLAARGLNVRIIGFLVVESMSAECPQLVSQVELKAPDMPLDMATIATAACDIGFFRLVMVYATARHASGKLDRALGTPAGLPAGDRRGLDFIVNHDVCSRDSAAEWLRDILSGMTGASGTGAEGGAQ